MTTIVLIVAFDAAVPEGAGGVADGALVVGVVAVLVPPVVCADPGGVEMIRISPPARRQVLEFVNFIRMSG